MSCLGSACMAVEWLYSHSDPVNDLIAIRGQAGGRASARRCWAAGNPDVLLQALAY